MKDLIERQKAIDALKGLPTWWADEGGYYGGAQPPMKALLDPEDSISALENLPSARPKINNQINLCDSCRHTYPDCPAGEDDILLGNGAGNDNIAACGKYEVEKRNTGRWVDVGSGLSVWPWKCSVCGGRQSVISDFCPDCGSKMKSKQFNFCDSCKHSSKCWDEPPCDGCCEHSAYEPIEGK